MAKKTTKKRSRAVTDIDKVIGQRVRQLRLQLDMSQSDLANEVGLTFQQIQKYEKGSNRISVGRMLEFVHILQTTPNDILGWQASDGMTVNSFSVPTFAAAREFAGLSEELQIMMRKLCTVIADTLKKKR